jgi:UDP-N-acetylglucosamine 2-epimerase (non-hydrolysing)
MLDQVLHVFNIKPDFDLNIMKSRQTLMDISVLSALHEVIRETSPDLILVHGDTTSFIASLAPFIIKFPLDMWKLA